MPCEYICLKLDDIMRKFIIALQLITGLSCQFVFGQCTVSSTDGYVVHITLQPQSVVAPGSCPFGYNYNVNLSYSITFTGTSIPGSLWTLQGNLTCGSDNLFIPLPTSGGTGTVTTTSNPFNTHTDCATATVSSLNCNAITVTINGPGIPNQTINCNYSGPLPIELIYFKASLNSGNTVQIDWRTASEINNNYFTIERSTDGINFIPINTVTSKGVNGNSTSMLSYTLTDSNVVAGIYYYRLKQTDFDFKYTYSNVEVVTVTQNIDFTFDLAPNPNDGTCMQGFIASPHNGMVTFKIYDIAGNRLYLENIAVAEGRKHPFKIQFKDRLSVGTYIVICILNEDQTRKKIMIVSK